MKIRPPLQSKVLRQIHQQKCLRLKPARFKFGDQVRVLFRDAHGFCLLSKRLDKGRFKVPQLKEGCFCWETDKEYLMRFLQDIEMSSQKKRRRTTEVRFLRKKLFGQKSEKVAEGQLDLFREMLVTLTEQAASQDPDPISEPSPEPSKKLKPRPKRRTLIPTESQNIEVSESCRPCPECGKHRTVIGHKRAMGIEYEPPKFRVISYLREKRACRACEGHVTIGHICDSSGGCLSRL